MVARFCGSGRPDVYWGWSRKHAGPSSWRRIAVRMSPTMPAQAQPIAFSRPFFGSEEEAAVSTVIGSGWVVGGPRLMEFEQRFATLCGVGHAVGVSSWTTG